jgi:hypothetical protein
VSGRYLALAAAFAALVGARLTRDELATQRARWPKVDQNPYAPSPATAPFVTLGYRELGADLLYVRTRVYLGGRDTGAGLRGLVDAVVALDPHLEPIYEYAARTIGFVDDGATQDDMRWTAALLERGVREFPDSWKLTKLLGEVYVLDLETDDPAQRAAWNARGAELLERAIHMPGAPRNLGALIAQLRSQLGQHERAAEGLLELIRTTDNKQARDRLIAKYAQLQHVDAVRLADEERWMKERFDRAHQAALPEAPDEMYLLLGDPPKPYIDPADLVAEPALIEDEVYEPLPED